MEARMPPTARWPLSCTMERASAPFRNSPSSLESARVNGMFMRERSDLRTGSSLESLIGVEEHLLGLFHVERPLFEGLGVELGTRDPEKIASVDLNRAGELAERIGYGVDGLRVQEDGVSS